MARHTSVCLTKAANDGTVLKGFKVVHLADFGLSAKITSEVPC